jgi:hypothetical protein
MSVCRISYNSKKKKILLDVIRDAKLSEIEYAKFSEGVVAYDEFIANKVCRLIASDARPLKTIVDEHPDLPAINTFYHWRVDYPAFAAKFHDARCAQAQIVIDEILLLVDDPANCEPEILNWCKERIKARQWMASRLIPKIYGDKQHTDTSVTIKHEETLKDLS